MSAATPAVGDPATASWADKHPAAAAGQFNVTPTALNTAMPTVVTFPTGRFSVNPSVVPSVLTGTPQNYEVQPSTTPSTTGVTITLVQTAGSLVARTVQWIAVEQL